MRISDWSSDVCSSDLLTVEFYLQTVRSVFQEHALPEGRLMHRGKLVDCRKIRSTALMTVEGEKDDICGLGQTEAAHDLCGGISAKNHHHYVQPRSEEHTSELQSLMRISYAVFCLKNNNNRDPTTRNRY